VQNVQKSIERKSKAINNLLVEIDRLADLIMFPGSGVDILPNYPDHVVNKLRKASGVKNQEIADYFFVSHDRASKYACCMQVSPRIKYNLVRFYLERIFKDTL